MPPKKDPISLQALKITKWKYAYSLACLKCSLKSHISQTSKISVK